MRPSTLFRLLLGSLALIAPPVAAQRVLETASLNTCQESLGFSAKLFQLFFYPDTNKASINIDAISSVEGYVKFDIVIVVYGLEYIRITADPCEFQLAGLCPMTAGEIPLNFDLPLPAGTGDQIPGIAYIVPDLDAVARIYLNNSQTGEALACVEADFSNGKTVDLVGVKWATAIIAGLALLCAAFASGLGYQTTAAHIAANALSLFGYFQAQAIIGLTGVPMPPLVRSWTQDFQWSMGIIHVGFMQQIFRWYQRATGGTPARLLDSLNDVSVQVEKHKRSLDTGLGTSLGAGLETGMSLFRRAASMMPSSSLITKRANIETDTGGFVVFGIQRVAFRAGIETTNLFMTGLTFFAIFIVFTAIIVAAFRGFLELAAKRNWPLGDKFTEFRSGWLTVLKGIFFRITLIGFPQITILCLWEFTQVDSPAEVVLAIFFFFGMLATLSWAAFKVVRLARRSIALHRTPAYVLFSDPKTLHKWGFLYIQFRASAYYFIIPVLAYTLVKGMIVAFGQRNGIAQAIGFILIEAAALIAASVLRPWMDKITNSLNIVVCVANFFNSICLLIFTNVFGLPGIVVGSLGVILVVINIIMSFVLIVMIIVKTTLDLFRKNPDAKYQYMADDRTSFMKSSTQLETTTELDALAATARGEKSGYKSTMDLDDGASIASRDSIRPSPANVALPTSTAGSMTSLPPPGASSGTSSVHNHMMPADRSRSPAGSLGRGYPSSLRGPMSQSRSQSPANPSPWQRGAGYD